MRDANERKLLRPARAAEDGPLRVDPYWDYAHAPSEGYAAAALRLVPARVFVAGAPTELRFTLRDDAAPSRPLRVEDHLFRRSGEAGRFLPVLAAVVEAAPPAQTFAVNVTRLPPGDYTLTIEGGRADKVERFSVARRPFFTFQEPAEGRAPSLPLEVRSSTGLVELLEDEGLCLAAAHEWDVWESAWNGTIPARPYAATRRRALALTRFDADALPLCTSWGLLDDRAGVQVSAVDRLHRAARAARLPPGRHEDGLGAQNQGGLPFPLLIGLPAQPDEGGRFTGEPTPPRKPPGREEHATS